MGLSEVCDCGVFWSCSLVFDVTTLVFVLRGYQIKYPFSLPCGYNVAIFTGVKICTSLSYTELTFPLVLRYRSVDRRLYLVYNYS